MYAFPGSEINELLQNATWCVPVLVKQSRSTVLPTLGTKPQERWTRTSPSTKSKPFFNCSKGPSSLRLIIPRSCGRIKNLHIEPVCTVFRQNAAKLSIPSTWVNFRRSCGKSIISSGAIKTWGKILREHVRFWNVHQILLRNMTNILTSNLMVFTCSQSTISVVYAS